MLDRLTHSDWEPLLQQAFRAVLDDGTEQEWTLASVDTWGEATPRHRAPYTLGFLGPRQPYAMQGIRRVRHAALGELEIFIVPTGPNRDGLMTYEAVFS